MLYDNDLILLSNQLSVRFAAWIGRSINIIVTSGRTMGFVGSVLATKKQRQCFYWCRNMASLACAACAYQAVGGAFGGILAVLGLVVAYFTIAPVVALLVCLIEQMCS